MAEAVDNRGGIEVRPLEGAAFGAKVSGVDPRAITPARRDAILEACRDALGLLVFDFGRLLEADELHALTAVFGANEYAPGLINGFGRKAAPGEAETSVAAQEAALRARGVDPYLAFIGNLDPATLEAAPVDAKFFGEWEWHTDMSYIDVPPTYSLLHARDIPAEGGDTGFCSQALAARALPPALRARVLELEIKHDSTYSSNGVLRPGMTPPASPVEAVGRAHPALRETPCGEALFLGRRTNAWAVGLPLAESEALLDELWARATRPEFQYRHAWREGEVVAWDNRAMLHMRHPVDESLTRFMWRTQTRGAPVVPARR